MDFYETPLASGSAEVKRGGIFGTKYSVSLFIYKSKISGAAFAQYGDELVHSTFDIEYDKIADIRILFFEGKECLTITEKSSPIFTDSSTAPPRLVFLGLNNQKELASIAETARQEYMEERQRQIEAERQFEEAALTYYTNCYSFHVKENTPIYTFSKGKNEIVALYIAQDKSLNFLQINGYKQEESVGVIPYDRIHYYEKAGNVSYTTDIHGSYSSYGGSFTGGKYSKLAAAVGGALFGYMGMTAGALFSYKPAKQEPINTNFSLDSDIVKIDDRNVILNFYSEPKRQYVDIELPQDMYNFLQTHLPEKKYGIVEELERQAAIHQSMQAIQSGTILHVGPQSIPQKISTIQADDSMDAFKRKVEKLKLMKDSGLLSDEEFDEERKKLLSQL